MQTQSSTQNTGGKRQQYISVELRQWIVQQAQAGVAPETVLEAMKSSGWDEDVAIQALEETLRSHLSQQQAAAQQPQAAAPQGHEPQPVPVPDARVRDQPSKLRVLDRDVTVLSVMKLPRVIVLAASCPTPSATRSSRWPSRAWRVPRPWTTSPAAARSTSPVPAAACSSSAARRA